MVSESITWDVITTQYPITLRNPFAVTRLPVAAKAYKRAEKRRDRWSWKAFEICRHMGRLCDGMASLTIDGEKRNFSFNAANTQFHSLYLSRYMLGYEIEICQLLELLLGPNDTFFDIGCNWGYLSLYAASIAGYRGHIDAFEPMPSTFHDLERAVTAVGLTPQIQCHQIACSDSSGIGRMAVPDGLHSGLAQLAAGKKGQDVPVMRLDECGLGLPQVIKIDVEGAEYRTLRGATTTINDARPYIIFEAWSGKNTTAAARLLTELNYVLFFPYTSAKQDDGSYVVFHHGDETTERELHFSLIPWRVEYRDMFREWLNAFACPRERLEELLSRFSGRVLASPTQSLLV